MKNIVVLVLFCFPFWCFAQQLPNKVVFQYDNAGNQIYRGIIIELMSAIASNRSAEDGLQSNRDFFGYVQSKLRYYPNPVQSLLYVEWDRDYKEVVSISLYSSNYQVIRKIENLSKENQTKLNFEQLPVGSYFMMVLYQDGSNENVTIVKK